MDQSYDFGMIGLGVMGSNLLLNIADHQFAAIGYDLKPERTKALEDAATAGTIVKGVNELPLLMQLLSKPRKIMILVPAGKAVDNVISNLLPYLEKGDILIDGGNSFFEDTLLRVGSLQQKGIHFFGMGVSGGEMGARTGPSMMPGGDPEAYRYLQPILEAIAATAGGKPCVAYMGNGAAGHYVKMVHNGIEYAMMQIISEAYDILRRGAGLSNEALYGVFADWNKGKLQSFLMRVTAEIFRTGDNETPGDDDHLVDKILDQAGSKGTGKWTSQEAMNLPIPIPTIDMAVAMRDLSVYKQQRVQASGLYENAVNGTVSTSAQLINELEETLYFSFLVAYAQGLSMLAKASEVHAMQIPLKEVVNVWKSGCIIRSAMLKEIEQAFLKDAGIPNILLDPSIAVLMKQKQAATRSVITDAVRMKIPVPAIMSALGYFDAYLSERLPVNLIQAQRDFFGAHTYQRIDKPGVFHTEWTALEE